MSPLSRAFVLLLASIAILGTSPSWAVEVLGTGTAALVGGDLTDPENDGNDGDGSGFNATFAASQEPFFTNEGAFNVFDNKVGTHDDKWCCHVIDNEPALWVQATFNTPIRLMAFSIANGNDFHPSRDADHWKIQGSNDGVNFIDIYVHNQTGVSAFSTTSQVLLFRAGSDFQVPVKYRTIRYTALSTVDFEAFHQLNEIELFDRVPGGADIQVNEQCSLRDAINSAQTGTAVGGCQSGSPHADRVLLSADRTFNGPLASNQLIFGNRAAFPDISTGIELRRADGVTAVTLSRASNLCSTDASQVARAFSVLGTGFLIIDGVDLSNGCATRGGALAVTDGAGLVIEQSRIHHNTVANDSGPSQGGAIYAGQRQAGLNPYVIIESATFDHNLALGINDDAEGGAMFIDQTARARLLRNSQFLLNEARGGDNQTMGGAARGGAIMSKALVQQMHGLVFRNNRALGGSGNLFGALAEGGAMHGNAQFASNWQLHDNTAEARSMPNGQGGDARGGAFFGTVQTLTHAWFDQSRAIAGSGDNGGAADGGAWYQSGNTDALVDVSFSGNYADAGSRSTQTAAGGPGSARGGAWFQSSPVSLISNVTIYANRAKGGNNLSGAGGIGLGGGWFASHVSKASHISVANNWAGTTDATPNLRAPDGSTAFTQGGGVFVNGSLTLDNSALADNFLRTTQVPFAINDCARAGTVTYAGYNVLRAAGNCDTGATATDRIGVDPEFKDFGDFGCVTTLPEGICLQTLAMKRISPMIDGGSCLVSNEDRDAVGRVRPQNIALISNAADACDIGALEARDGDGDSAVDVDDNCPTIANTAQADDDGDGLGNSCDACFHRYEPQSEQSLSIGVLSSAPLNQVVFDLNTENGGNADQGISYTASGAAASIFAIQASTGQVTVINPSALGAAGTEHSLQITASDCESSSNFTLLIEVLGGDQMFANSFE